MVSLFMKCYIRMLWLSKVQRCKPLFTSMSVHFGSAFVTWFHVGACACAGSWVYRGSSKLDRIWLQWWRQKVGTYPLRTTQSGKEAPQNMCLSILDVRNAGETKVESKGQDTHGRNLGPTNLLSRYNRQGRNANLLSPFLYDNRKFEL